MSRVIDSGHQVKNAAWTQVEQLQETLYEDPAGTVDLPPMKKAAVHLFKSLQCINSVGGKFS